MRLSALLFAASAVLTAPLMAVPPVGFAPIDQGHVDVSFCFKNGVWETGVIWELNGNPVLPNAAAGPLRPSELAVILVKDQPVTAEGNRIRRPAGAGWNFVGVGEDEPFWWLPQAVTGNAVWAGFNVCAESGCVPYFEDDPRVSATSAFKTVALKSIRYHGKGEGHVSMWSTGTFGDQIVWMKSIDGISAVDKYFVGAAGHAHPSWGFSDLGLYEITVTLTCYQGPGKTNPATSPPLTIHFAVGTYWEWIARNFQPARWNTPGFIGGGDDPDGDGIPNLVEYASGLNPREADRRETPGTGAPGLPSMALEWGETAYRFPLRDPATNPQIEVVVRATENPAAALWPHTVLPVTGPGPAGWLDAVCPLPVTGQRGFLRMEVTLLPELIYSD